MTTVAPTPPQQAPPARAGVSLRLLLLLVSVGIALLACLASLTFGSRPVPLSTVFSSFTAIDPTSDELLITNLRLPRTVLGLFVGSALAVAGALIQAYTRNPLADPGVLGVNAGAGFAMVLGSTFFGVTTVAGQLPFTFIGAIATTVFVYAIAARGGATPLRLTLVGVALGAALTGISNTVALLRPEVFDQMRNWGVGSIANRPPETALTVAPFIIAGLILALCVARPLNAFALGDDLARSLGTRIKTTQAVTIVAVTLLCGAATAAAGPIAFIGLMIPHAVRWFTGPSQGWIILFSITLGPVLILTADIIGRLVVFPAELQVGIVAAFIGAPVLILLVHRTKAAGL